MPRLSEFYVSAAALMDGQWHCVNWGECGPVDEPNDPTKLYFRIGSSLSPHYEEVRRQVLLDFGRDASDYQVETECIARGLLLDWKHYEDDAGQTVPYSVAESSRIMSDPRNAVLRAYVKAQGTSTKRLRDAHLATLRGNSLPA